mmetsp:Transcript_18347/g.35965  ORF Transcript_18347/g.35965 Transcript_18347/m.35965 type:complete len:209 (-) Transcript_18347:114-740(-)
MLGVQVRGNAKTVTTALLDGVQLRQSAANKCNCVSRPEAHTLSNLQHNAGTFRTKGEVGGPLQTGKHALTTGSECLASTIDACCQHFDEHLTLSRLLGLQLSNCSHCPDALPSTLCHKTPETQGNLGCCSRRVCLHLDVRSCLPGRPDRCGNTHQCSRSDQYKSCNQQRPRSVLLHPSKRCQLLTPSQWCTDVRRPSGQSAMWCPRKT